MSGRGWPPAPRPGAPRCRSWRSTRPGAFRSALRTFLPTAAVSVDAFHLVKLANDTVTAVRQRAVRDREGRRGRGVDPAWIDLRLLLRAGDTLSRAALDGCRQPCTPTTPQTRSAPPAAHERRTLLAGYVSRAGFDGHGDAPGRFRQHRQPSRGIAYRTA